jgi:hypothetical protein
MMAAAWVECWRPGATLEDLEQLAWLSELDYELEYESPEGFWE